MTINNSKSNNRLFAVIALTAILIGVAYSQGYLTTENVTNNQQNRENLGKAPDGTYLGFTGDVAMQVTHYDAQATTTTRTEGTNVDTSWYVIENGEYVSQGSGDNANFDLKQSYEGFVFAQVEPKSSQYYYLAIAESMKKDSRIIAYNYFDIDGDGSDEHVFTIWCGDLKALAGGESAKNCFVNFRWDTYGLPGFVAGSPDDITGVGTSSGTVIYPEWYTNFTNTNTAWLLYQVELKVNTTSITKFNLEWVNIPGLGEISGSKFVFSSDGTNSIYKYTLSNTLDDAHRILYGNNEVNKQKYTTKLKMYLSGSDQLGFTLTLRGVDTTEKVEEISDTVGISES